MENTTDMYGGDPKPNPAQAVEIIAFHQGDEILREGEESPFFQVVLSGRARVGYFGKKIRILGEQDVFGLENLVFKKPSYYSVTALDKCRIAKYGPEALDHLIRESPRMVQSLLLSTLQQLTQTTYFLADNPDSLDEVRVRFYDDGDIVLDPDSPDKEFCRLVSTQAGLRVRMGDKEIARIDKPGEFFGYLAGPVEVPARATVVSAGDSVVEVYGPEDLDLLIRDHPDAARRMMRSMMLRLDEVKKADKKPAVDSFSGE